MCVLEIYQSSTGKGKTSNENVIKKININSGNNTTNITDGNSLSKKLNELNYDIISKNNGNTILIKENIDVLEKVYKLVLL